MIGRIYIYTYAATFAAVAGLAAGYWVSGRDDAGDRFASCRDDTVIQGTAAIGGALSLVDETGRAVTDRDVFTRPALVYFGYTNCPDDCPLDAVRNADTTDLLKARGLDIRTVFISIDPDRDTPEVIAEYTDLIDPDMLGLTGTPEQVQAASLTFKTYYQKQAGDGYYLVDHSAFSYLILPGTGFVDYFPREETSEQIAETAACYLRKSA